jgi:hypothetical protein
MMVPKKSLLLAGAALAMFGAATSAQTKSGKVFARYNKPLESVTLNLDTGTITRGPKVQNRKGTTVVDFDNNDLGGFVGVDTGNGFCQWIDAGIKGTNTGRTGGGPIEQNTSDLMNSIVFAYCTAAYTPGSGGPGGTLGLSFYEGYTLFGGAATTAVANFTLSGLPGNTGSSSFFGGFSCFFLQVFFEQLLCFSDGPIGYGFKFIDAGTGTINPLGAVLAGTWAFLSCTVSCSAAILQTDLQGMTDAIDEYCPPGFLRATFTFGTTSGSFTSVSMAIGEVIDQTATITRIAGIPAAPDVLTANAAVAGANWTATLTSGFARTKTGSWTLFFGSAGVLLPTGFDVTQFPAGGGNFGTNKAGRRLLCNISATNPSGCANIPLPPGLGSTTVCGPNAIPKKINLVCNAWCGQAVIVGNVPAGAGGGGNTRLSNSIQGVLGTNF